MSFCEFVVNEIVVKHECFFCCLTFKSLADIMSIQNFTKYEVFMIGRYNHLNKYLKNKFGERVLKIGVDGGFTCPNRDGTCGTNGCIFCSEEGSGEHLSSNKSIAVQVKSFLDSYKGIRANKFIAYFQNFSNTYDTLENLKTKYDSALIDDRIIGLAVATRPDCINEEIAKLLKSYSKKYYVCVELGLQTANDVTGKLINRGYNDATFIKAVNTLRKYGIDIVTHIMIGLPNETKDDLLTTINFINSLDIQGIKIHSTYIVANTKLEEMYIKNEYRPLTLEEYIDLACFALTHLRKDIIIHRISGDAPKDILVAPSWNAHKKWIMNGITKKMENDNLWQGMYKNTSNLSC